MHVIAPGASTRGFTLAPLSIDLAGAIAQLRELAKNRKNANAQEAMRQLEGTDKVLWPLLKSARPRIMAILRRFDSELARGRKDPARRRLTEAAIAEDEAKLKGASAAELDELEGELISQVEKIQASLFGKYHGVAGSDVTDEEEAEANKMADRLRQLTPEFGLGELAEFMTQVAEGWRPRAELAGLLPILQSAYDHEGSAWTQNSDLLELIQIAAGDPGGNYAEGSLLDGVSDAAVLAARLERADRFANDLRSFFWLARNAEPVETQLSKKMRDLGLAGFQGIGQMERPGLEERDAEGHYRLLPDDLEPPRGVEVEDALPPPPPYSGRRLSVSPEQRESDQQAREAALAARE